MLLLDSFAKGLAGLEVHVLLRRNRDRRAGGRVAALAGTAVLGGEGPETGNRHFLAGIQSRRDQALSG